MVVRSYSWHMVDLRAAQHRMSYASLRIIQGAPARSNDTVSSSWPLEATRPTMMNPARTLQIFTLNYQIHQRKIFLELLSVPTCIDKRVVLPFVFNF